MCIGWGGLSYYFIKHLVKLLFLCKVLSFVQLLLEMNDAPEGKQSPFDVLITLLMY